MPVTVTDEKLISELTSIVETVEVRAPDGRFLGMFSPAAGRGAVRAWRGEYGRAGGARP